VKITTPDGTVYTVRDAYSLGDRVVGDNGMVWFDGKTTPSNPAPMLGATYGCTMEMGDMRRDGVQFVIYGITISNDSVIGCDVLVGWQEVKPE
jgi:hypothetical protein